MKKLMFPKERKLIALVLAFVLAIAGIGVYQAPNAIAAGKKKMAAGARATVTSPSAVNIVTDKVVESPDWWANVDETGSFISYPVSEDTPLVFYVGGEFSGDVGEFMVEIRSTKNPYECFTTLTNHDAWLYVTGNPNAARNDEPNRAKKVAKNHVYKITVTQTASNLSVVYDDITTGEVFANFSTSIADWPASGTTAFVRSQIGTYRVGKSIAEGEQPVPTPTIEIVKMLVGAKQDAVYVMDDEGITGDGITWTVADTSIAEVAGGKITAKAAGETTITAVKGGTTVEKKLVVTDSVAANGTSPAMQVGDDGIYLTCHSVTEAGSTENWATPRLIVNNGAGSYTFRADNWVEGTGYDCGTTNLGSAIDWPSFLAENLAGTDCYISAVKVGDNVRVRMSLASISTEQFFPIVDGQPFTVALTNWKCTMTNVRVVDKSNFNDPGPVVPVVPVYPGSVVTPKPVVTPGPEIDVPITPSNVKVDQTVTGTAWWEGSVRGDDYSIPSGDGSMVMYVSATELNDAGYGAFSVEVQEGDKYFTTGSDHNAWIAEKAIGSVPEQTIVDSHLIKGHVYRITVTRKGKDITVNYYDATDQKDYYEVTVSGSNFGEDTKVHLIAQVGTFGVGQEVNMDVDPSETVAPPEVTVAPPADVTTAPDVTAEPSSEPSKAPDVTTAPSTEPSAEPEPDDNKGAKTGSKVTVSGNTYKVNSGSKVTYTAKKKNTATVTVPATVKIKGKTYKVTAIGANAFKGNKSVKKITVSKNITKIGKSAFSGCKKLKTIVIKSKKLKASGIAKGAFKGITKKTVIKVPKGKKKAYQKMFRKKGLSKAVKVK